MSRLLCTLPSGRAADFEPFAPEPVAAAGVAFRAPPRQSLWQRLTAGPFTEHNLDALAADLAPTAGDGAAPASRRKRIVVCADGTWNEPTPKDDADASTNVWRLYQLVKDRADDGTPQLKYYHAGVGTTGPRVRRLLDGGSGRGVTAAMKDCYEFVARHYRAGDAIYLFGFSRGAYTARALAGLIRNCGILDYTRPECAELPRETLLRETFELYRRRDDATSPVASRSVEFRARYAHPDLRIACIGVWDTVGALGIPVETRVTSPIWYLNNRVAAFHDVTLSAYVDCAFHALALDERRSAFVPTLWLQQPHAKAAGQILEQVWFPGAHSDVGGGYGASEAGLANVTLRWMVNRVSDTCGLEFDPRPLAARETSACAFAVHDSLGPLFRAAGRLGVMRADPRTVDGGLSSRGVRDAERLSTEALHGCVETFAAPGSAWQSAIVSDYRARVLLQAGPHALSPAGWVDRRRATSTIDVDAITLEQVAADGSVTSSLTFTRDGQVRYAAGGGAAALPRGGALAAADWAQLVQQVGGRTFFDLADEYAPPDARGALGAGSAVTLVSGRRRKRVASYARFGPAWLEDLGRAVDGTRARVRWDDEAAAPPRAAQRGA